MIERNLDMPTVPIPAEIVGDTDTIRARLQECRDRITSAAVCLGRQDPLTKNSHLRNIIDRTAVHDVLREECERRWLAWDLAHGR